MSNESIVAMAIGVMFGAIIMIIGISVILSQVCKESCSGTRERAVNNARAGEGNVQTETVNEQEIAAAMYKQWENFFNYNGSDKGQTPIGGDE